MPAQKTLPRKPRPAAKQSKQQTIERQEYERILGLAEQLADLKEQIATVVLAIDRECGPPHEILAAGGLTTTTDALFKAMLRCQDAMRFLDAAEHRAFHRARASEGERDSMFANASTTEDQVRAIYAALYNRRES